MFRGKTLTFVIISCFMAVMMVGCFGSSTEQNDVVSVNPPVVSGGAGAAVAATATGTLAVATGTVTFTPSDGSAAVTVNVVNGAFSAPLDTTKTYTIAVAPTGGTAYTVTNFKFPAGAAPAASIQLPATTPTAANPVITYVTVDRTSTTATVTKTTIAADAQDFSTTATTPATTADLPATISDITAPVISYSSFKHALNGDVDRDNIISAGDILEVQIGLTTVEVYTVEADVRGDLYRIVASKKFTTATQAITVKTSDLLAGANAYDTITYYMLENGTWMLIPHMPISYINETGGILSTGAFAYTVKIYDAAGNYAQLTGTQTVNP
jgi:hypothetical protein